MAAEVWQMQVVDDRPEVVRSLASEVTDVFVQSLESGLLHLGIASSGDGMAPEILKFHVPRLRFDLIHLLLKLPLCVRYALHGVLHLSGVHKIDVILLLLSFLGAASHFLQFTRAYTLLFRTGGLLLLV